MNQADPLSTFPPAVRDAYARWLAHRDPSALDTVVMAIVAYHLPHRDSAASAALSDSARLMSDLGFDSLALAEIVFFVEDLFKVTISSADLANLATVADLRAYVRAKVRN